MSKTKKKQFIRIGKRFIHIKDIRKFEDECGCWGKLWLWNEPSPIILGDGSYEGDGRHVSHLVCSMKRIYAALSDYSYDCDGPGWRDREDTTQNE